MSPNALVALPVILPLFGAGLALALYKFPKAQRAIAVAILAMVLAVAVALLVLSDAGPVVIDVGGWSSPVGISLVADRLAALMLTVSAAVTLCVLLYSIGQGTATGDGGAPVAIYYPTYLILSAGVANAFLTGDLFNLYVGFEILLAASYVLLTVGATRARIRAGSIYVVMAIVSSVIFLLAIALVYAATGTVNMAQLAERLGEISPGIATVLHILLLLAFGVKAAVFPLSFWLPDSYPTAPAPVTAVFAGLLTKVGVYAMIRAETLLFPGGELDTLLGVVAIATMLMGVLGAIAQSDIKRVLSFTLVSHIGFMVFGLALPGTLGLAAAVFYVVHHITVQTALFLVTGLVERAGGSTALERLGGLARTTPLLALLFFVPAMALAGIPPLSGFVGKVGLLEAGADAGTTLAWSMVVAAVLTSLLTLYALIKVWNHAFWKPPAGDLKIRRVGRAMVGPAAAMVVLSLVVAVGSGPLYDYASRASDDLLARTSYITAVFPGGAERGTGESDEAAHDQDTPTPASTSAGGERR